MNSCSPLVQITLALLLFTLCEANSEGSCTNNSEGSCTNNEDEEMAALQSTAKLQHKRIAEAEAVRVSDTAKSLAISSAMQQMAARLPAGPTKDLLKSFQICTSCNSYKRVGEHNDGGYLTCLDGLGDSHIRAAYSMGVEAHDKFSADIYKILQTPVHQFDCTVDSQAQNCPDCHFHKICLKGRSGHGAHPVGPNMDLSEVLNLTGQSAAPKASLMMKMDIEGAEWPILADGGVDLSKFKQLIFEFHNLEDEARHAQYAQALKNIFDAGFRLWHIHGNNYAGMYTVGEYSVPNVIELTFLLEGPALQSCLTDQEYLPHDHRNNPGPAELPMLKVPPS